MYKKVDQQIIRILENIVGKENVITDEEKLLDYSHDEFSLPEIRRLPETVVKPNNTQQVSEILKLANEELIPVTPRGGGTGLCGGCVPVYGGIVLSLENMNKVEIDPNNLLAIAEAGVSLREFYKHVESSNFFFAPHPGDESATIGGVIATNAGGARAVKYGVIRNFVRGIEVVLADGEIINIGGKFIKNSSGYSLLNLMIGSEGTLGVITKAIISLLPPPRSLYTLVIPYNDIVDAIKTVPLIIQNKILPVAVEFIEYEPIKVTEDYLDKKWPYQGVCQAYLMIIVDGSSEEETMNLAEAIGNICLENNAIDVFIADTKDKQQNILDIRSQIYEAMKRDIIEILDITVPPASIAEFVKDIHKIEKEEKIWLPTYGHAADGNVHTHIMKSIWKEGSWYEIENWQSKYYSVREKLHSIGKRYNGIISGEHGIGLVKKKYLDSFLGKRQIELMKCIKKIFDPNNILNPGKIV